MTRLRVYCRQLSTHPSFGCDGFRPGDHVYPAPRAPQEPAEVRGDSRNFYCTFASVLSFTCGVFLTPFRPSSSRCLRLTIFFLLSLLLSFAFDTFIVDGSNTFFFWYSSRQFDFFLFAFYHFIPSACCDGREEIFDTTNERTNEGNYRPCDI
jgi:hypothetical protein